MTKHILVALLMMGAAAVTVRAQGRQPKAEQLFDPFPRTNKIEYARAVEMAKDGDAAACYWLAYYFAKGEGVDKNLEAACRFLIKAEESGYPRASYLLGRLHEFYSLRDGRDRHLQLDEGEEILDGTHFDRILMKPPKESAWHLAPWGWYIDRWDSFWVDRYPSALKGSKLFTNEIATAYLVSLYEKAAHGGLSCATNDIARVKRKITECFERTEEKQRKLEKGMIELRERNTAQKRRDETEQKALSILEAEDNAAKDKEDKELREDEAKHREERKLWMSWPNKLDGADTLKIVKQAEGKFNCAFFGDFSYGGLSDWGVSFTNSWKCGGGVSLIAEKQIWSGRAVEKFDSEGRLVWVYSMDGLTEDAEELNWISAERKAALEASQLKWAQEHNMTLDEAKAKYAKWKEEHTVGRPLGGLRRPGMLGGGSLRARRLQRQQESGLQAK